MMEELKVLRDITLFYHERHPEIRAAGSTRRPAEDTQTASTRQHFTRVATDELGQEKTTADKSDLEDKAGQTKK